MRLTLLIPELIWPEPGDTAALGDLPCPALGTLLARSKRTRTASKSDDGATFDASIAHCFGLAQNVPFAPLRLLGEGIEPGTHHWACADPVHLKFHHERLILAEGATIGVSAEEAGELTTALNQYFGDIGKFSAAAPDRWYLQLVEEADFQTPPLSAMAGRRIEQQLPEESRTAWLRKLLNEAQMVLHSHACNEARADAGRMTVNSLWLWGPGQLPCTLEAKHDGVWSAHPLAKGLARCAGIASHNTPASFAELCKQAGAESRPLVVIDTLLAAVQYEDAAAWRQGILELETQWFAPLLQAVRSGRISLELRSSTIYDELCWQPSRTELWQFWKRPKTLAAVAAELAEGL
jgi:hypothetical protein